MISPGALARVACVLEATARKPGNVHRFRDFEGDATYLDFLLSAGAIVGPMDRASGIGIGRAILEAVEETRRVVASNTNLGMVLLLAPLCAVEAGRALREGVAEVLGRTTVADASVVYRAIRLARPGGLGRSPEGQDVADEPTGTLQDVMRLAEGRDLVARQYARSYIDVFECLAALRSALDAGRPLETAIIAAFLDLLARRPDTLIVRKRGEALAAEASSRAAAVLASGWPEDSAPLGAFDAWLRLDGHCRNPGASADVVTAALFAGLRDGTIPLPLPGPWSAP